MPGWLQKLKKNCIPVPNLVYSTTKIATGLKEQVMALPQVGKIIYNKPQVRGLIGHMGYIMYADLLPIMFLTALKDLSDYMSHGEFEKDEISCSLLLSYAWMLTGLALSVYKLTRYTTQTALHTQVLMLESTKIANEQQLSPYRCEKECNKLRHVKGMFRQMSNFLATEVFIQCVGYFPVIGGVLSPLLSVYHRGQFVTMLVMPYLCERHMSHYLQEYPELAFSLGLSQELFNRLAIKSLESFGMPAYYYENILRQFSLVGLLFVASTMKLPPKVADATRNFYDPLVILQRLCGNAFDNLCLAIKAIIPVFLKRPEEPVNWREWIAWAQSIYASSYTYHIRNVTNKVTPWMLPPELLSFEAFSKHRLIKRNWKELCNVGIGGIEQLLTLKNNPAIALAVKSPRTAALFYSWLLGGSRIITEEFLRAISSPDVLNCLDNLLQFLKAQIIEYHSTNNIINTRKDVGRAYPSNIPAITSLASHEVREKQKQLNPGVLTVSKHDYRLLTRQNQVKRTHVTAFTANKQY